MSFFTDPNVVFVLLMSGFAFIIMALVSPGTGIIEILALFALLLAGYGMVNLPLNLWALVILLVGVGLLVASIRRTTQRYIFLALAVVALSLGSVFLFSRAEPQTAVNPVLAIVVSTVVAGFLWWVGSKGLEVFRQPLAFNPSRLIGATGVARTNVFREGTIYLNGEEWTARSEREIQSGSRVRVTGREGLILLVEPLPIEAGNISPAAEALDSEKGG